MDEETKRLIFSETERIFTSSDNETLKSLLRDKGWLWLSEDPSLYLEKFGSYLTVKQLNLFERLRDDYEVCFYLNQIQMKNIEPSIKAKARNRRFARLEYLSKNTDYFSLENLMKREPAMVKEFLGRRFCVPEKKDLRGKSLSETLLDFLETIDENETPADRDIPSQSSRDHEKIGSIAECFQDEGLQSSFGEFRSDNIDDSVNLYHLKKELVKYCQDRFIDGQDKNIDYSLIDHDDHLDSLYESDLENVYFADKVKGKEGPLKFRDYKSFSSNEFDY